MFRKSSKSNGIAKKIKNIAKESRYNKGGIRSNGEGEEALASGWGTRTQKRKAEVERGGRWEKHGEKVEGGGFSS